MNSDPRDECAEKKLPKSTPMSAQARKLAALVITLMLVCASGFYLWPPMVHLC